MRLFQYVSRLMAGVGLLGVTGCGALLRAVQAPPAEVQQQVVGTPRAPVPEASVEVISTPRDLPAGFFFQQADLAGQPVVKLWALPEWPTPADAHAVVAALQWTGGAWGGLPDEVLTRAAALGADAVLVVPGQSAAYALHRSAAPEPTAWPEAAALLATEREKLRDFEPLGEASTTSMAAATTQVKVRRGQCYAVVGALAPDARWGAAARVMVAGRVRSDDALIGERSLAVEERYLTPEGLEMIAPYHGKVARLRSFALDVGCAWADGVVAVGLAAAGGSAEVGTGTVAWQVLSHPINEVALEKAKAAHDVAVAEARAAAAEAARAQEAQRAQAAEQRAREAEARARQAEQRAPAAAAGPGHFSLTLKNECPRTVRLFDGDKPKFGSGTYSTIGANTIQSMSGFAGRTLWIVDEQDNGMSSYTLSAGRHDVIITASCGGFARR